MKEIVTAHAQSTEPATDMAEASVSLVLSGGAALGAYQAGACSTLLEAGAVRLDHVAGSSTGAVNAALIAGNDRGTRRERLHEFWSETAAAGWPVERLGAPPWRTASDWLSVARTRLFGRPDLFYPRLAEIAFGKAVSLYDLAPLRAKLQRLVDFDRLNEGSVRVTVVATDMESGAAVCFDNRGGARVTVEHILASCGLVPEFPPVEVDGRLLGDGGFAANAPVRAALGEPNPDKDTICFVIDAFSSAGSRPPTLERAAGRRLDLLFGNQTLLALEALRHERELEAAIARLSGSRTARRSTRIAHLRYRGTPEDAGPERMFDYSSRTLRSRWTQGCKDMNEAIDLISGRSARAPASAPGVILSTW